MVSLVREGDKPYVERATKVVSSLTFAPVEIKARVLFLPNLHLLICDENDQG